ncbi:MAG: hypothetical protein GX946_10305 [Oligosphaeraceae bacterium]|nr:hypothetical protein [Oligosphaeraceae bacterium]
MAVTNKKKTTKKTTAGKYLKQAGKLLWAEPACGHKIADELLRDAEEAVAQLVPCMSESNDEQATQAFFALEAMVMAALNPECSSEQCWALVTGLCQQLPAARDAYSRSQLIRYLGLLGYDCAVEALRPWLNKKEYFEVTLLALRHIGSPSALELIAEKMATAKGSAYTALVLAVAEWENDEIIDQDQMRKALAKAPENELPALWNACARCGLLFVAEDLLKACKGTSKATKAAAHASLALLISRIYDWETAVSLGQQFYQVSPVAIALRSWFDACATDITADCYEALTDAVQEDDPALRETALELLGRASDCGVEVELLVEFAGTLQSPSAKAAMVRMLGRHGKMIARPFIMACLWDKEPEVRQAAHEAAENLQGKLDVGNAIAVAVYRD